MIAHRIPREGRDEWLGIARVRSACALPSAGDGPVGAPEDTIVGRVLPELA